MWGPARRLDLLAGKAVVFQAARAAALSASRATRPDPVVRICVHRFAAGVRYTPVQ